MRYDSRRAKKWRTGRQEKPPWTDQTLKLCYWNCNGLGCMIKQQQIQNAMEEEQIDIMFVDETHFRQGANNDLSIFKPWTQYYKERGFGEKNGGGKLILVTNRINHMPWVPDKAPAWVENERSWIRVHNQGMRLAICTVYMAAEVIGNTVYQDWNITLYGCLTNEIQALEREGYGCVLMGDFNGHVGCPPEGIEGNRHGINFNGHQLLNFAKENDLKILNKEKNLCEGTFTRITPTSSTILDYVLVTESVYPLIKTMKIDEGVELLAGSDHVSVRLDVRITGEDFPSAEPVTTGVFLSKSRDKRIAAEIMDKKIEEFDWVTSTVGECFANLQRTLVDANTMAYPNRPKPRPKRVPKSIKRLIRKRQLADKEQKQLSVERVRRSLMGEEWTTNEQDSLNAAESGYQAMVRLVREKSSELKLNRRTFQRTQYDMNGRQFWSLYKKTEKKRGRLNALKDADGNLQTDINKLEDIALTNLARGFCGMRSRIFESRGEQIIKELRVQNEKDFEEWIPRERWDKEYEDIVCTPTSAKEIKEIIDSHKSDRAPGVDGVLAEMLKHASNVFVQVLTDQINRVLEAGEVPEMLQTGKMTLIDKKKPSLEIQNKRPLTVSSIFLSVIAKLIKKRMDPICEEQGFYGSVQYGFRSERSTTDCVFIILAVIREARRKHRTISIAFCDLAKAYDSVCRELLYTKLSRIGFGGKVVGLIRSMYYNDCIRLTLPGKLTSPLWFTKGVKQGCALSPMLFALYVAGLGNTLHASRLGVTIGNEVITALFFADDLVIISCTAKTGMDRLLEIVARYCNGMNMKLAVSKTFILTSSQEHIDWMVEDATIEEVLVAKYLGVDIQIKGRNMVGNYEANILRRANSYAMSIMNLTRSGLDRALIARKLWIHCAIPGILYCTEAMVLSKTTVRELERIQNMVGRFILQVPSATSRSLAWMDAGLMPMQDRIMIRQANYIWTAICKRSNPMIQSVLKFQLERPTDPYTKAWMSIQKKVGIVSNFPTRQSLNQALTNVAVEYVLQVKAEHTTMRVVPQPEKWFALQDHVNDSAASRALCCVRGGNTLLGNRFKNRYGRVYEWCPHCEVVHGKRVALRESHVIFCCPAVARQRRSLKLSAYKAKAVSNGQRTPQSVLRAYLGGDGAPKMILLERGRRMAIMIEAWLLKTHE